MLPIRMKIIISIEDICGIEVKMKNLRIYLTDYQRNEADAEAEAEAEGAKCENHSEVHGTKCQSHTEDTP